MSEIKHVYIVGAGVAGLTAAHELVERGFTVTVFEKAEAEGPHRFEACAVGGVARTQVRAVPRRGDGFSLPAPATMQAAYRPLFLDQKLEFEDDGSPIDTGKLEDVVAAIKKYSDEPSGSMPSIDIQVVGSSMDLAERVADKLSILLLSSNIPESQCHVAAKIAEGDPNLRRRDSTPRSSKACFVVFHVVQDLIPGEHGYRFFPSFYVHLFDTMRRTQVFDPHADHLRPSVERGSVYDRLRPTSEQEVRTRTDRFVLPRRSFDSLQGWLRLTRDSMRTLGIREADIVRVQSKLLQYMTSCDERRVDYERMSWLDFLGDEALSQACRDYLASSSTLLLAMDADEGDARTYGSVTTQMLLDQMRSDGPTDALLRGPTSSEWLEPWRNHLDSQGVRFVRGEVGNLEWHADLRVLTFQCGNEGYMFGDEAVLMICTELDAAKKVTAKLRPTPVDPSFADLVALWGMESLHSLGPNQRLMTGIQFFFDVDVGWRDGHTAYIGTEWGLSSVAQPQFWWRRRGWWDGYRGVLSVDIGCLTNFEIPAGKSWHEVFAERIWAEIRAHLEDRKLELPYPTWYHVDEALHYDDVSKGFYTDYPMLVTLRDTWETRPGQLDDRGYQLAFGRLVLAGTYMKTYTRLTTMEAANESARHAVNAILRAARCEDETSRRRWPLCRVWTMESREPEMLRGLKLLDRELYDRGLPHALEISDGERWGDEFLASLRELLR
ncbi:FAD-dependent oxidoreductase [Nannocystaceae bacterium ST9]